MAAPRLSTAQGILVALILAAQAKTGSPLAGIPIAREQFGYMDPTSEANDPDKIVTAALADGGGGIAIYVPYPITARQEWVLNGATTIKCLIPVFLMVNPEQNERGDGGLKRDPLVIVEEIWSALKGKTNGPASFALGASPMGLPSDESGIRSYPIDIECTLMV